MNINEPGPAPKPESTKHLRVLANGAVYDMKQKRIVANPGGGRSAITPEKSSEMQARWREQKQEALRRAANAVAAQGGSVDGHLMTGDYAYVEAIGEAMTMKALTINDPKAVDAARFIFTETGISERQVESAGDAVQSIAAAIGTMLIEYVAGRNGDTDTRNVIDAE